MGILSKISLYLMEELLLKINNIKACKIETVNTY